MGLVNGRCYYWKVNRFGFSEGRGLGGGSKGREGERKGKGKNGGDGELRGADVRKGDGGGMDRKGTGGNYHSKGSAGKSNVNTQANNTKKTPGSTYNKHTKTQRNTINNPKTTNPTT